jgi:hypothetical protein
LHGLKADAFFSASIGEAPAERPSRIASATVRTDLLLVI